MVKPRQWQSVYVSCVPDCVIRSVSVPPNPQGRNEREKKPFVSRS